jgi:hypothetical protein
MARHNPRERRLFHDLNEKNRLAEEFRLLSARLRRWQNRMRKKRGKRWQAQYARSIRRAQERLAELQPELLSRAEGLKARIQEEQKVSRDEVKQFEQQYKKEVAELKEAQQALEEARDSLDEAKTEALKPEEAGILLADLRRKRRDAAREMRRESRDLKRVEQEMEAEEQDKAVLSYELRRIVAEIEGLRI